MIIACTSAGSVLSTHTNTSIGIDARALDPDMMKKVNKMKLKNIKQILKLLLAV